MPDSELAARIRQYFFTSTAEGYDSLLESGARWVRRHPLGATRTVLEPFWSEAGPVNALFAVDVIFLDQGGLWRQVAGRDGCFFEQNLTETGQRRLMGHLGGEPAASEEADSVDRGLDPAPNQGLDHSPNQTPNQARVAVVVGAFARACFIYGNRTHRAVGMSAGIAIGAMLRLAALHGARPRVVDRFVDHAVNSLLGCDGVDRGVVALVDLRGPATHQARQPQECHG